MKKGFTLVELLAVIVILGVVFMFIVPRLSTLIKNGETKQKEVLEAKIINAGKEYVSSYDRTLYDNLIDVGDYNYVCLNNLLDNKLINESDLNGLDEISGIKIELQENDKVNYIIEYGDSSVCDNSSINLIVELNGGILSTNVEGSYAKGSTVELGVPTKEGETFSKWVVTKGSGEIEGNTLKMHYTDVTVYALYKSLTTLTVDKNGGSSSQEFEENYPTGTIIELEDLTKTGYVFTGWEVVSGNSVLSGKRITIGSTDTTIKGIFTLGSYTCSAGAYLKAGETSCSTCETGSYCPGGTYQYNPNEDQGISGCPGGIDSPAGSSLVTHCKITCEAGTYLKKGETSCSVCEAGSYCTGGTYPYNPDENQGINGCPEGFTSSVGATSSSACFSIEKTFDYTGGIQTFTVPQTGIYKLEVWGAQGGYDTSATQAPGGKGGYASGEKQLSSGQIIYVCVGGQGESKKHKAAGGYNGGGRGGNMNESGAGGGATHIAFTPGLLAEVTDSNLIIAAGGGGGAGTFVNNNHEGGAGSGGNGVSASGGGGTSTSGGTGNGSGSRGQGGIRNGDGGGGGGGYYGGGAATFDAGGGGGSGYTSGLSNIKIDTGIKEGNGYAKISFVSS